MNGMSKTQEQEAAAFVASVAAKLATVKVKRCYYCGAKTQLRDDELIIFHRTYCKPAHRPGKGYIKDGRKMHTTEVEDLYPEVSHAIPCVAFPH